MDSIFQYNKALVALVVPLVVFVLNHFGFVPDNVFISALGVVLSGFFVWLVPNKK